MLPALVPTPPSIRRGYQAQVIGNLTGVCPLCQQTADRGRRPTRAHPAIAAEIEDAA